MTTEISTADVAVDLLFVGAGPVGLFGAYCAGFRGLSTALVDALPEVGGQVQAIYPEKNIYDVAGLPGVQGQQLIRNLTQQAEAFAPKHLLSQQADTLERLPAGWRVTTSKRVVIDARAVVITSGVGAVTPRPGNRGGLSRSRTALLRSPARRPRRSGCRRRRRR